MNDIKDVNYNVSGEKEIKLNRMGPQNGHRREELNKGKKWIQWEVVGNCTSVRSVQAQKGNDGRCRFRFEHKQYTNKKTNQQKEMGVVLIQINPWSKG